MDKNKVGPPPEPVEACAILELVFLVFEENELISADVLLLSWTFVDRSETTIFLRHSSTLFWCKPTPGLISFSTSNLETNYENRVKTDTCITHLDPPLWDLH